MNAKSLLLLILVYLVGSFTSTFANGRAKWLVDSQAKAPEVYSVVIKEAKTPPAITTRGFDYDHQGEMPRGSNVKSLEVAVAQQGFAWAGLSFLKISLPARALNIYSFRFRRLLLFPHHVFD